MRLRKNVDWSKQHSSIEIDFTIYSCNVIYVNNIRDNNNNLNEIYNKTNYWTSKTSIKSLYFQMTSLANPYTISVPNTIASRRNSLRIQKLWSFHWTTACNLYHGDELAYPPKNADISGMIRGGRPVAIKINQVSYRISLVYQRKSRTAEESTCGRQGA